MITILIPTASRPTLLATALRSVSEQTAVKEIVEVIVSESKGDSRSREICQQFPSLPIKYIFREPQMKGIEHLSALKKAHWSGEYTVMLHDDDWWTPDFLHTGIEALNSHPRASCFCCNSYNVPNEESIALACPLSAIFWFGANFPSMGHIWEMSMQEVLLGCLLHTPAIFSTMMARSEALRDSAIIYDTGNRFDVDRMFIFELSRYGTILYSPIPQAFYRIHAQQDVNNFSEKSRTTQMCQTTEWIINRSGETVESIGNLFCARFDNCPKDNRGAFYHMAMQPWALPILAKQMNESSNVYKLYDKIHKKSRLKSLLKPFIPPIIVENGAFLRNFFRI